MDWLAGIATVIPLSGDDDMKTPDATVEQRALLLRTLGHPIRLRIVAGLAGGCACVKEIWECLGLPQAVVSQHLKVMKEHGILDARRDGARVCYSLKEKMLAELVRVLGLQG